MVQIVRRKKKGRPSKADLARRNAVVEPPTAAEPERDVRRSGRRRNVRYTFDFDDYIDEEDYYFEDDEEDERTKEKKLKLLLKLQEGKEEGGAESTPSETRRVAHAPTASASSSDYGDGNKPFKKRKIDGDNEIDEDVGEDNEIDDDDDDEVGERKVETKAVDSVPGTPSDHPSGIPLPDKKTLELILDKLQKKDIYGVFAEPVDPEELPDYHDVIKHPMDFTTVRSKLGHGTYSTFEQFESDVFLICTNAMQYNAPDTIYYKQAFSIQELAKRKFLRLKIEVEHSEIERKSEQKTISNSLAKKQIKKPMSRTIHEAVGSDFSSGATLATAGDFQNGASATQAGGSERPSSVDRLIEANSSLIDNNLDKGEELLPGKGLLPRSGRKQYVHDENRRSTYNISNQPVPASESMFTTFEGESKQLVPVGLHSDHSYARSLARFAATLGSVAWKVASHRIEQALPAGFKFGRGWVGEYEPLPTPVLLLEKCSINEPALFTRLQNTADVRKDDKTSRTPVSAKEHPITGSTLKGQLPLFGAVETRPNTASSTSITLAAKDEPVRGASVDGKMSFFCSPGIKPTDLHSPKYQQQNSQSRNFVESERKVKKQVELNCPPPANQSTADSFAEGQVSNGSEMPASRSMETVSRNRNLLQSVSFKQPNVNGIVPAGLPNGKVVSSSLDSNSTVTSSTDSFPNQMAGAATYFPHGQEQGLSDPVQLMRMLAEKGQNQHGSSNHSLVDVRPVVPPSPSSRREDSSNAAAAAARAWMSIGAGGFKPAAENTINHKNQLSADSLYNMIRDRQPQVSRFRGEFPASGMHFPPDKNTFPFHAFVPQMGNEAQFHNRPMVFPQLVMPDLSRFQVQSPWQALNPQTQPRQKQELLPPDLNIGYQSSGSPVRQSSGVLVDSQQPDLALQL